MEQKLDNIKTNVHLRIKSLWEEGFFESGCSLKVVLDGISKKWGDNPSPSDISNALKNTKFLRRSGRRLSYQYIQRVSPISKRAASAEEILFSPEIINKLKENNFETELKDLRLNFGNSGTCSAFLLRKILEKLIYIVFSKNGLASKIEDKNSPGGILCLESLLQIAQKEKVNDTPILMPKTAQKIQGTKFLGDVSAHNYLINVDMDTILPQMPYIITAYKELIGKLK